MKRNTVWRVKYEAAFAGQHALHQYMRTFIGPPDVHEAVNRVHAELMQHELNGNGCRHLLIHTIEKVDTITLKI